jgi:Protein of unknown function (DUF4232)
MRGISVRRGLLVAAVTAGAVCATGSGALASDHMTPHKHWQPMPVTTCYTANLRPGILGSEGAAGSVYVTIGLTNVGKKPCVLRGHPGVAFARRLGRQVGASAAWTGGAGLPVTVAPGGKAKFVVRYVQAGIQAGCDKPSLYLPVAGLRINAPGDHRPEYLRVPDLRACVRRSVQQLTVDPVTS